MIIIIINFVRLYVSLLIDKLRMLTRSWNFPCIVRYFSLTAVVVTFMMMLCNIKTICLVIPWFNCTKYPIVLHYNPVQRRGKVLNTNIAIIQLCMYDNSWSFMPVYVDPIARMKWMRRDMISSFVIYSWKNEEQIKFTCFSSFFFRKNSSFFFVKFPQFLSLFLENVHHFLKKKSFG